MRIRSAGTRALIEHARFPVYARALRVARPTRGAFLSDARDARVIDFAHRTVSSDVLGRGLEKIGDLMIGYVVGVTLPLTRHLLKSYNREQSRQPRRERNDHDLRSIIDDPSSIFIRSLIYTDTNRSHWRNMNELRSWNFRHALVACSVYFSSRTHALHL